MIPKSECVVGGLYRVGARNWRLAVYTGDVFIGVREKFGAEYLDSDALYEDGGCVVPREFVTMCPVTDLSEWAVIDGPELEPNRELFDWLKTQENQV